MVFKTLNISGTLLDEKQLLKHIEDVANNYNIKMFSDKNTYPMDSLNKNYQFILETYQILNEHIKLGIKIHSVGEWILDNFYIIEEVVKTIRKELSPNKYHKMIGVSSGPYDGFSRSYLLAEEVVSYTDCKLDAKTIFECLEAYQKNKMLSIDEIENFGVFLKISIVNKIKNICEKIYSSEVQRLKAESIIERIVENKNSNERKFTNHIKTYNSLQDELKYPFIEYMSYKLKKFGKDSAEYLAILEEEVSKLGISAYDVVQKEHLSIANLKIIMGNCIKSLRDIGRINFGELLGKINGTETILNKDPQGTYPYMDQESKNYYKSIIERLSKKTKISEIYIAEKIVELCNKESEERKRHVGYFLIDKGFSKLISILLNKNIRSESDGFKARLYIASFIAISLVLDFLIVTVFYIHFWNTFLAICLSVLSMIPISEIVLRILNYLLSKFKKPAFIPKMDYEEKVPEDQKTFVIIPTILNSEEKVKEMMHKLEVYFLANSQENIYFALLGDVTEASTEELAIDQKIAECGITEAKRLNEKYKRNDFCKFHFLYRTRTWSESEEKFIGWERKRGLISIFNQYIKNQLKNPFLANTIEFQKEILPDIKYIITLDSDTNLVLNSASKLVGAVAHVLNRPVIKDKRVVEGYGIMQPRIGLDLELYKQSKFTEIYSIPGGIDLYSNAISDIYQDWFREGIFTGKGIYDVQVYNETLKDEIPDNIVLSHDLLEGNYLRCALVTDCMLIDGYPSKYLSYIKRNDRWIRGDWQIIRWLRSPRLNELSKFKILDNLRRSLLKIFSFSLLIASLFSFKINVTFSRICLFISILSISIIYLLDVVNYIVFKESNINGAVYSHKKFSKDCLGIRLDFLKMFLELIFLPFETSHNLFSIIKSFYRMTKKKKLLEWVTAEEGEKQFQNDLMKIFRKMLVNVFGGIVFIVFGKNWIFKMIGLTFLLAPCVAFQLSKEKKNQKDITPNDQKYLREIGLKTWRFFEDHITKENNYLICDNYQEDRPERIVKRTSSTNIGLELISVISSYDLGYISFEKAIEYLKNMINTIKVLPKWNGHLYNWYKIDTLEPLKPRYISTVDSGNFIGYLYIVRNFLEKNKLEENQFLYNDINYIISQTNFSKLYDDKTKLFSIGFNLEENKLTDSYYDFLASEARQASLVAIAKKDVPAKHWNSLSRTITIYKSYKGLISWTGTAFEYLMPNLNLKRYPGSLLDESSKFAILSQKEYCKKLGVPWGISESAYSTRDLNYNYQYKAFGIPWLGLKRGLEYDLVISPYSTFLALGEKEKTAISNIRLLEKYGGLNQYGFFESIDFTSSRLKENEKYAVVKTYMAHHQGLILNSINNYLNQDILQKRFNQNPEIEAVQVLLQERMPLDYIITKEKKQKPERPKIGSGSGYIENYIIGANKLNLKYHVISNENYKIVINTLGEGYSEYKRNLINRYQASSELMQGIHMYVKNLKSNRVIPLNFSENVVFSQDKAEFIASFGALKFKLKIILDPNKPVELRRLEIENFGINEEVLEVIVDFIPVLSLREHEYAHQAFNHMFLNFDKQEDELVVERHNRTLDSFLYTAVNLCTENAKKVDNFFELDCEKYLGRNNFGVPKMISESENFSNSISYSINKIVSQKQIFKVDSKQKVSVNFLMSTSENKNEALENLREIKSENNILKMIDVSKIRVEEEMNYLQISSDDAKNYYDFLNYILDTDISKNLSLDINQTMEMNSLWKFGISGDLPIVVVKAKALDDIDNIQEMIECYMYYRIKNIYIDLVILNEESNVYERFVRDAIDGIILDKQINYLKNMNSGIFILNSNEIEKEDLEVILLKAKVVVDSTKGGIQEFIKSHSSSKIKELKKEDIINPEEKIEKQMGELLFNNGYGGFSKDKKEYQFCIKKDNPLPTIWSNVISNKGFGIITTENMHDLIWNKNSRLNRLTSWNNDTILNIPSQIIYLKNEENNKAWTLNSNIIPNSNYYYITYGFGYSKYKNVYDGILQQTDIFVPNEENVCVTKVRLKNTSGDVKKLKILVYLKTVVGEDENTSIGNCYFEKRNNLILMKNMLTTPEFNKIAYVTSNQKIKSFTKSKKIFLGNGNLNLPDSIFEARFESCSGIGNCLALEFEILLNEYEEKYFVLKLGQENEIEEIYKTLNRLENLEDIDKSLLDVTKKWNNLMNNVSIKTPDEELNVLMNGWLIYQTISCRIWGKSGFYQSGGANGFRDQLQDCLGMKYIDISLLKEQILKCCRHQFKEGDVLHWWHDETRRGVRTKFSDDLLWLPYSVFEYVQFCSDYDILEEQVEYLVGDRLKEEEVEVYHLYFSSEEKESVYEHCIKAIDKACDFGGHGLPKIGARRLE